MDEASPLTQEADPQAASLADLLERLTAALQAGQDVSLEQVMQAHPQHAERLRALWPALQALAEVGTSGGGSFTATDNPVGTTLGDFRIIRVIGRGGMGVVYEAVQMSLGRHVALKVLPAQSVHNPGYLERFKREARAAALLHHTNIVPVYGVGECDGVHFYAMQFIRGRGLDAVLRQRRQTLGLDQPGAGTPTPRPDTSRIGASRVSADSGLPPAEGQGKRRSSGRVRTLASGETLADLESQQGQQYFRSVARAGLQVAEALDHAHAEGILHRDIKPSNLLLDDAGVVWITDFGLARLEGAEDLTASDAIVGTLRYMAPERFRGQSEARGDIYSLGVTLYELLTLRPAHAETDPLHLMERVANVTPQPPRRIDPTIPPDLETIVLKAIAREPGERYATAAELAEDLRRFLDDRPILARPCGWFESLLRWRRRNPVLALAVGAAAGALLVALVVSVVFAVHASVTAQRLQTQTEEITRQKLAVEKEGEQRQQALNEARKNLEARQDYERQASLLAMEKAIELGRQGQGAQTLLWLARSLELYPPGKAPELEEVIRRNLSAWGTRSWTLRQIYRHENSIAAFQVSPDGKRLMVLSSGDMAHLWDTSTGQKVKVPIRMEKWKLMFHFSPDSQLAYLRTGEREVWLIDPRSGLRVGQPIVTQGQINLVQFRPDSKVLLVTTSDAVAQLWDTRTGKSLGMPMRGNNAVLVAQFTPDSRRLLLVRPRTRTSLQMEHYDATTGVSLAAPIPIDNIANRLALDREGKIFYLGSSKEGWLERRDTSTGLVLQRLTVPRLSDRDTWHYSLSADCLFVHGGTQTHAVKANPGLVPSPSFISAGVVHGLAVSDDGHTLLTAAENGDYGEVRVWDLRVGLQVGEPLMTNEPLRQMQMDCHGQLWLASGNLVSVWGPPPGKDWLRLLDHALYGLRPGNDGRFALLRVRTDFERWDLQRGRRMASRPMTGLASSALGVDGRHYLEQMDDGLRLQDLGNEDSTPKLLHCGERVGIFGFSTDGLTVYGLGRSLHLWETATGRKLSSVELPESVMRVVQVDPVRILLLAYRALYECERKTGKVRKLFQVERPGYLVTASPDGRFVLSARLPRLSLHDLKRGSSQLLYDNCIAYFSQFLADGRLVLTGAPQGMEPRAVEVWDTHKGKLIGRFAGTGQQIAPQVSADGQLALTQVSLNEAQLWHLGMSLPLGPRIRRRVGDQHAGLTREAVLTGADRALEWRRIPQPIRGDVECIRLWAEVITGRELDRFGRAQFLGESEWRQRRAALDRMGWPTIP